VGEQRCFASHLMLGSKTPYRRITYSWFDMCIFTVEFEILHVEQLELKKLNHYTKKLKCSQYIPRENISHSRMP